jgi:hypothetical protein
MTQKDEKTARQLLQANGHILRSPVSMIHQDYNRNTLQFDVYHGGSYPNFIRELKVERIITKTE